MDFLAFSHGQTQSKQWLCENLEPFLPNKATIAILGSWYNILGFMILTRNHKRCQSILGIDIDPDAIKVADQICQGWMIGSDTQLRNELGDANTRNLQGFNVIINCSPEHMESNEWFDNIDSGALVCIQTSNMDLNDDVWKVTNPNRTLDEFAKKYPLSHTLVSTVKDITYDDWGYQRYMIIGIK